MPPESEDSVNAVATEAEPLTPQHQTAEPGDQLPVKKEAWVGPEEGGDSSQPKGLCSDEKADTSIRYGDGYEMSSTTSEQKEEASPVAKRSDVDEKVQSGAGSKVEPQGSSATESRAATPEAQEERANPKRKKRTRRGKRGKNVTNTNATERPEGKGSEDPSRKKSLDEQGGKQANFSDATEDSVNAVATETEPLTPQHQTAEPGDQLPVKKEAWVGPEEGGDSSQPKGLCSDEKADTSIRYGDGYEMSSTTSEQKEEASPVAKRSDVDEKVQSGAGSKVEPQGSSATESRAATPEAQEERANPKRKKRTRRGKRGKNVTNTNATERPEGKGSEDPSRKKSLDEQGGKQANFSDAKAIKRESAAEKPEEKTTNKSPRKGENEKRGPPKTYDDFKGFPNDNAVEKEKGAGQQREAQEKFDDSKGFGQGRVQEKQVKKSPGGNQRKGKHPQDSHQRNDDLRAEPLKGSPAAKEQGESGKPRSAERGPVSFPKRNESPPRSNPRGKKEPAGVGRGTESKGSDTTPGASNRGGRGGTPNRRRRAHRSSNKSSTVGDTRQPKHSTP